MPRKQISAAQFDAATANRMVARTADYKQQISKQMNGSVSDGKNSYNDITDQIATQKGQVVEIYHVNTGYSVMFKAMLTDFKDDFKMDYKRETVFGRADPIATYKGTERTISLAWKVVASHLDEAKSNLRKIEQFASMLYATYDSAGSNLTNSSATQIQAGPLFKIKYSNLIVKAGHREEGMLTSAEETGLAGTIDGFTFTPEISDSAPWYAPGVEGVFPASIDISLNFHVLHETALGWDPDGKLRIDSWANGAPGIDQRQIFYGGQQKTSSGKKEEMIRTPVDTPPPPAPETTFPALPQDEAVESAANATATNAKPKDLLNVQRQEMQQKVLEAKQFSDL